MGNHYAGLASLAAFWSSRRLSKAERMYYESVAICGFYEEEKYYQSAGLYSAQSLHDRSRNGPVGHFVDLIWKPSRRYGVCSRTCNNGNTIFALVMEGKIDENRLRGNIARPRGNSKSICRNYTIGAFMSKLNRRAIGK